MAISKINTGSIADNAVTNAKVDSSYTTAITTNPEFAGTEAAKMPSGTTAQRANAQAGDIRFNSTISLMEYYDGTIWKAIDAPPAATSISPSYFTSSGETITITGINFSVGANVKVINASGTEFTPDTVTRVSSTSLTFDINNSIFSDEGDPFDVKVINASGLSSTLEDCLEFAPSPVFSTSSGSIGTIYDSSRSSYTLSAVTATSSDSDDVITYAITSGALPSGLSLNSSTGAITGTANSVGSDTTSNFTVTATATSAETGSAKTASRAFSATVRAPVISSFTTVGTTSWTAPTGLSSVRVLVVAGGGGGGSDAGGGGGAGGLIHRTSFSITAGNTYTVTVGAGGTAGSGGDNPSDPSNRAGNGGNSVFGTLIAIGGGYGGMGQYEQRGGGTGAGGSGGGGGGSYPSQNSGGPAGLAQQSSSASGGYGNNGSAGLGQNETGGGGGGAGGAASAQNGGVGLAIDITGSSVYYAGGGGAGGWSSSAYNDGAGGNGGGGNGGGYPGKGVGVGYAGTANTGGGGGGGNQASGGAGGSGIVIVRY